MGTEQTEAMIAEQLKNAERLGLEVTRLPTGEYLVKHPSGIRYNGRLWGRVALREFLQGYEFNEDVNGYIIGGTGKWMEDSSEDE